MVQLNDSMASQIMGELDAMTRKIDDTQKHIDAQLKNQESINILIAESKKQLVQTLNNLKTETEALKEAQVKSIHDQLAWSMRHIEKSTKAQLDIIEKAAQQYSHTYSKKEAEQIVASAVEARDVAIKGVLGIIDKKFSDALGSVAGANKSFEDVKRDFVKDIGICVSDAKTAVGSYDTELKKSVSKHRPIGVFGSFMLALLASAISAGGVAYYIDQRAAGEAPGQAKLAEQGARFNEVFQQLDAKTQEKITRLWK